MEYGETGSSHLATIELWRGGEWSVRQASTRGVVPFEIGKEVEIYWRPSDPDDIRLDKPVSRVSTVFLSVGVTMFLGAIVFVTLVFQSQPVLPAAFLVAMALGCVRGYGALPCLAAKLRRAGQV